jgi:hypothetical protein
MHRPISQMFLDGQKNLKQLKVRTGNQISMIISLPALNFVKNMEFDTRSTNIDAVCPKN